MNVVDIETILCNDAYVCPIFAGCFSSDALCDVTVDYPSAYVWNYDPSHEPGTHWVAVFITEDGKGEYFDSYGLAPLISEFSTFLNDNTLSWRINGRTLQGPTSHVCGHYCIFYLLHRCRGRSMDSIVAMFGDNTDKNDDSVERFVQSL
jgi:hypothetical protein